MEFDPKKMKHSKKNFFFLLSAVPTILVFCLALFLSVNREKFLSELEHTLYKDHLSEVIASGSLSDQVMGVWSGSGMSVTLKPDHVLEYSESGVVTSPITWNTADKNIIVSYIASNVPNGIIQKTYPVESITESQLTTTIEGTPVVLTRDDARSQPIVYEYIQIQGGIKEMVAMAYEKGHWYYIIGAVITFYLFIAFSIYQLYISAQSNGIRIHPGQFPKAYAMFAEMAKQLGFEKIPELYLKNGNGVYNAYATCIPGYRSFAVVHAEIFESYENGGDEGVFRFVVGHELGHVRMGHVSPLKVMLRMLGNFPFVKYIVGLPGTRAIEYEADKVGEFLAPGQGSKSLLMLISSKSLYNHIDVDAYCSECEKQSKLGYFIENAMVDHPILPWRIDVLRHQKKEGGIFFHTVGENK